MNNLSIQALNKLIDDELRRNMEEITKNLTVGADDSMSTEEVTGTMISNCLSLSVKISTQLILGLLEEAGVIQIDEKNLSKLFLQHLSSKIEN